MKLFLYILATVLITLGITFGVWKTFQHTLERGINLGIDAYHKQCYDIGGFVVHKQQIVMCKGLGPVPEGDALDKLPKF